MKKLSRSTQSWFLKEEKTATYTVQVPYCEEVEQKYTVMVPVKEEKTATYTVQVPYCEEVEQNTVMVPVKEEKTATYTVMVPVKEEKTCTYTVKVPYTEEVEQTYTVQVPYTEQVQKTRTVKKRVPVCSTKTVQVRGGHWENQMTEMPSCGTDACGNPCPPKMCCKRVWVPTCEEKEVQCTTYDCVTEEVLHRLCSKVPNRRANSHCMRAKVP